MIPMKKGLVIVESPTKARTLSRYLGKDFEVKASIGHVKDLPKNELGVDIEKGFIPHYMIIRGKGKILKDLKRAASKATDIYLAPDPDREGEAIAWHIAEELMKKRGENRHFHRVLFRELTRRGIKEAMDRPVELDEKKYESQKARRILDRLVGYQVSPLLWEKVKRGLSAGRVQSVALRLICEREKEIRAFISEEYWTVTAQLKGSRDPRPFEAKAHSFKGKRLSIKDQASCRKVTQYLEKAEFLVSEVKRREVRKNPFPPFITSTLQQEASRRFRFPAKKTMQIAQKLYEGVEIGKEGPVGLITYMRTDSTRVSEEAVKSARSFIIDRFGNKYVPKEPPSYKKGKMAQDAHEAIRPTSVARTPEQVAAFLSRDELRVYELIWKRFVASQMTPACFDQTQVTISAGDYTLKASGSVLKFPGFQVLYKDEDQGEGEGGLLPELQNGDGLELLKLKPGQHFTQPPPRYTEASLIKELDKKGIGRPSTYATILSTIRQKDYVKMESRHFVPTELGMTVVELLINHFPRIFDPGFTAQLEQGLDQIEAGGLSAVELLSGFYGPFKENLERARTEMRSLKAHGIEAGIECPECHAPLLIRYGRSGEFLACSRYPECKFTSDFERDEKGVIRLKKRKVMETNTVCPKCGRPMVIRHGRYGEFLACSGYPECGATLPVPTGIKCPEKGCEGELVKKFTRTGKVFYGCNRYPECRFAIWDEPVARECPVCGAGFLVKKGDSLRCKRCNATFPLQTE